MSPQELQLMSEIGGQAVAAERERCAKIAESAKPTGETAPGPLFGAGIAAAAEWIAGKIREGA